MGIEKNSNSSILPKPDGPLLVRNLEVLKNTKGEIDVKPTMALCRCGHSNNKPFCDGTHSKIGFSSDKLEDRAGDRRDTYRGKHVTIRDNRSVCAHAGYCTDRLSSVFRMKQEPWIDPDAAGVDDVIAAVEACPSGALSYSIEGVEPEKRKGPATIHVTPNGPYVVTGEVEITDTTLPHVSSESSRTLCRCGGSKNKPFCDGSHWYNNFKVEDN